METPQQTLARIRGLRKYQPSAIGNSLFMLLVRYTSLAGFFVLAGISVYMYLSYENPPVPKDDESFIKLFKELAHLKAVDLVDQAYLLMIVALMLLVVYKLTTMVLRRNSYIFMMNEVLDGEE